MPRFLLPVLAIAALAWNVPAAGAAAPKTAAHSSRAVAVIPDPAIGPNAADEARHAQDAALLAPSTSTPIPLGPNAMRGYSAPLGVVAPPTPFHREVFGFAPYWALNQQSSWNYRLLSTVAYFGLTLNRDGIIDTTVPGYSQWGSQDLTDIINNAHANGDRVVVVVKQFQTEAINRVVTDPNLTDNYAIPNIINAIAAKNLDGVNIDFEGALDWTTYPYLQSGIVTFMSKLSTAVHARWPSAEVSIDTYSGSASWDLGIFKIGDLARVVDAMFIMAYDMVFENQPGVAGANAPLTHYTFNDTTSVTEYLTKAPASKILLGVPYYGYKWSTTGNSPNSTINPALQGATADTYSNIVTELACNAQYKTMGWDSYAQSPYMSWYSPPTGDPCDGNWGSWRELYYDSAQSLGIKYDLVNQRNLRGAGMWALGYDGGATELWNAIAQKLTTTTPWDSLNGLASADPAVAGGTNRLDVFIRGTDNAAWRQTWNGTQWLGAWESLGGTLSSALAAVSPATGRLDIFVRGTDNALWHRWWDGASWHAWDSIGGNLTSGPDATTWAANRMDVFVRGTDNALWHRPWDGTNWLAWESVGGILTSDPAAVSYTTGRLDVFVRGNDNQLWHRAYDTGGWGAWEPLGGNLASAPSVASCGMFRLDVFAVHADRALWRRSMTQVGWADWQSQGGQWASGPAATCQRGSAMTDVFERAQDGTVWHSSVAAP